MTYYWVRFRARILSGAAVLLLGILGGWWWLESAQTAPVPVSMIVDHTNAPVVGIADSPAASGGWDTATISARQSEIASAMQCSRTAYGATTPLTLDPALAVEASDVVAELQGDLTVQPQTVLARYEWATMITLDQPVTTGCGWEGWATATTGVETLMAVGIAVIPPVGYAPAAAIIIGRTR